MALYDELPVFKASYDLLLDIYRFSSTLTREFKFTIGEKLKNETLQLLILVFRANSEREKIQAIQKAREQIEMVRLLLRVLKDLKQISLKSFVRVNQQVENVSKQLSGWQKSQR